MLFTQTPPLRMCRGRRRGNGVEAEGAEEVEVVAVAVGEARDLVEVVAVGEARDLVEVVVVEVGAVEATGEVVVVEVAAAAQEAVGTVVMVPVTVQEDVVVGEVEVVVHVLTPPCRWSWR